MENAPSSLSEKIERLISNGEGDLSPEGLALLLSGSLVVATLASVITVALLMRHFNNLHKK
ncbi:MAG: hypothetical protein ACJKTH_00265 [Patescibacteria group bacterium UBA2163]